MGRNSSLKRTFLDKNVVNEFTELQKSIKIVVRERGMKIIHIINELQTQNIMGRSAFYRKLKSCEFTASEMIAIINIIYK